MPSLLIVEDDKVTAEGISFIFNNEGFEVDIAPNGKIGFERLQDKSYNIIITDIRMPEMDGMQLLSLLKATGRDIPVIIITAYGSIENMLAAMELGAADIIEKPFDIDVLIDLVNNLL